MNQETLLDSLCDTIRGLQDAADSLQAGAPAAAELAAIVARGGFRPTEDEAIGFWFARFLTAHETLWTVIEDSQAALDMPLSAITDKNDLRLFVVGYAAMCLLVRLDRLMLFDVAGHSIVQRKLNEPFPEYRIPRKQYTKIFSAFVDQRNVLAIRGAMKFMNRKRSEVLALRDDQEVGFIVQQLGSFEETLNPSARRHLRRAWSYLNHKWRRRGVVSARNVMAALLEGVGRTAAEIADLDNKHVTADIRASVAAFLQPGDVIITRHAKALTNLFIPGFWPHSALYIGTREQAGDATIDPHVDALWCDDVCVLEARKDGVRLRELADTLAVDKFVVLRPNLARPEIARAIERALKHHGKMYNFDFDFFNSDRVVCTELIYRAYDGLGDLSFPLRERAGRKTLSAEDLLDYALDRGAFTPVAIFGVAGCEAAVTFGEGSREKLLATYREPPA